MDSFMSLPPLILLLVLVTVLQPSMWTVILVLIFFIGPSSSRVIRGSTLVLKEQQFVEAARSLGASPTRVMVRHILPNIMAPILVLASVLVGSTIVTEAALSFLGLGANTPQNPTWGFMLFEGVARGSLDRFWWLTIIPGLAITLTVLSFNLLGDALRDIFDPRLRGTGSGA
jgi:peptide/nickel transport system permease protein